MFGLIGLSVAASALSVWLIRRFSSRPSSAVLSQAARTPHQVVSFQHPHAEGPPPLFAKVGLKKLGVREQESRILPSVSNDG